MVLLCHVVASNSFRGDKADFNSDIDSKVAPLALSAQYRSRLSKQEYNWYFNKVHCKNDELLELISFFRDQARLNRQQKAYKI